MKEWKPNALKLADVDSLERWQLIVGACHFGPNMQDCVEGDYGYHRDEKSKKLFCGDMDVTEDISPDGDSMHGLVSYAGFDIREWCRERIREGVKALKVGE